MGSPVSLAWKKFVCTPSRRRMFQNSFTLFPEGSSKCYLVGPTGLPCTFLYKAGEFKKAQLFVIPQEGMVTF